MAFIKLEAICGNDIVINADEISSCHVEGGFSYTDYVLVLKNGTRYYITRESFNRVMNLTDDNK